MSQSFLRYAQQISEQEERKRVYPSQCPFCSMQCKMQLVEQHVEGRTRYQTIGVHNPTTHGRLCIKGQHAHQHALHKERLNHPLIKRNGQFVKASWQEALNEIKTNMESLQMAHGHDAISVYGSASITNEEAYLLGKFARVALKTKYIDYNGRLCMSSAATAANQTFGLDRGLTFPLSDIKHTRVLILVGTNIAECQPTFMPYVEEAKKNGAFLIVIDPRKTQTAQLADVHVSLKPGSDAALANGILHIMLHEHLIDESFIRLRTSGFQKLKEHVSRMSLSNIAEQTGVMIEVLQKIARKFAQEKTGMIFTARGIEQQIDGTASVRNFLNILLVTGKIGRVGCGYGAITGQGNGQGAREHGQKADQLPGYRDITNSAHRKEIADIWNIDEKELPGKGVSAFEMFEKMQEGEIKALFLMCSNPVQSGPHARFIQQAIKKLSFFVAVDLFMSETAALADVILPTSSYLEDEGTVTNVEGRVTLREATYPLKHQRKHDWQIICDIAAVLGKSGYFSFSSAEEIFEELRAATKGAKADYSGMTYERLRKEQGILWPCTHLEDPGTERLFEHAFSHSDSLAKFAVVTHGKNVAKEPVSQEYPLYLTTGRVMAHYQTGVQTRKSTSLVARQFESYAELHPDTAKTYGLQHGELVTIQSKRGSVIMRCRISDTIRKDTVFVPFHWSKHQSINQLISEQLDPHSKMPGFKYCPVELSAYVN
ncbi:molybdopterin oxidoreductase family protein [Bacillus pumilus]|uniref:assimilatory nitrate reductase catalytic subunit NasC n=1 Tax=Bacillus TaxID=1386 RepID=UPI000760E3EE|nr:MULTISPECIES: molybdopterin oxidoreductase family protein [Bacillus]MBU5260229.1 molybdopterin oxidoreductase family protein [Bacillus pumilus]PRS69584.1 nitrite reductase [Bacillus sp. NMTD17]QZD59982.1 molybdopterin oxidoreductase family protein [Bacillus pumilus]WOP22461.1 molybdopterin oxidoreductase family protein [Bacillus pumilus]